MLNQSLQLDKLPCHLMEGQPTYIRLLVIALDYVAIIYDHDNCSDC